MESLRTNLLLQITTSEAENLERLLKAIPDFIKAAECKDQELTAKWYDLETCFKLRGGGSFSTFRCNRYYQPKGGIPDAKVQGRNVWSRETVAEWLKLTDKDLPEYHKKYMTGVKAK